MKVLCQWIITAGDLFESVIIKNEIPITDMPPASQTALDNCMDEDVVKKWETMKGNLLGAAFRELELCSDMYSLPNHNDLIACSRESPLDWNPDTNFEKHPNQSLASFEEQQLSVRSIFSAINKYIDYTGQFNFVKCKVIAGIPGSGKSFILNYMALYAMSKGLKVLMTELMARRAVNIGGIHLHKLFFIQQRVT